MAILQDILKKLCQYLHSHNKISAAWLFGSVAKGTIRKDSDIDIAILFQHNLSAAERFDLRLEIMDGAEALTGIRTDVIDMESAPLFLQYQVRKTGKLLVEKDRQRRVEFDVRSRREYFDFQPVLERRAAALLKKIRTKDGF
ncbi:hypothetical protein P22_4013 [Propionispora sp. 2/2-37]|uniref:type VII toxin-antitoxin system MntA family adenylyltransferase antitoxin n=1 Tax=Propionispora sp. 2/2-37 TaxID=1677858 RepID=UPI0006BB58DB|nr:nucleotidyltransferase domain-containing protein [Propionispora sp. 2/2-37]CUH97865.1 hypothetical protein P22_4013 [Propionispora sp. 2/2-37]